MNSVIEEWINKAEADYRTAERESAAKAGLIMMRSVFMLNNVLRN
jgi:hypothetical protein